MATKADSWQTVKELLSDALTLDADGRRTLLDGARVADDVRREVEALLALEPDAGGFMSLPASGLSAELLDGDGGQAGVIGSMIGSYEVVRELGTGGMGSVFLGRRTDGKFEQSVAIKFLRREFNAGSVRELFKREIRIQSKLDHQNIARVLDAGTTGDGIPYIVMEFVDGVPIDRYCAENDLTLKDRLKLFAKVCASVAVLHENLIIHRDLKPSNILVTADGTPKLLDFGVSKLLDAHSGADTLNIALTPQYASPEQKNGAPAKTTADIYSLGVVLYKMLTEIHPFVSGASGVGGSDAMLPSRTCAEPSRSAELRGDIDNIILKAMSTEPEHRYRSADAFAADIWRYVDGQPVEARTATVSYRLRKFIKRNKIGVAAGAIVVASLITGAAIAIWQANVARAQAAVAESARNIAEIESVRSKTERAKAEKITAFMSKIIAYGNPAWYADGAKYRGQARVIGALEDLSDKIDTEFAEEPDVAAELHHKFAEVFLMAGKAQPEFESRGLFHSLRALELRKQAFGEWHELVAKDLFYAYGVIGKTDDERAELLMRAIMMMRDTNPRNLNLAYMLEAYTAALILPEYAASIHDAYYRAILPATGKARFEIAEEMLRESLPIFRYHYRTDNSAVYSAECKLAYTLVVQRKWDEFDQHMPICQKYQEVVADKRASATMKRLLEQITAAGADRDR